MTGILMDLIKHYAYDDELSSGEISKKMHISIKELYKTVKNDLSLKNKIISNTQNFTTQNLINHNNLKRQKVKDSILHFDNIQNDIINTDLGMTELSAKYNTTCLDIRNVAKYSGIREKLKINNSIYKGKRLKELGDINRNQRINSHKKQYGEMISNMINQGYNLQNIKNNLPDKLPHNTLLVVIDELGLSEKRLENTRRVLKQNAIKISSLGAEKTRGIRFLRNQVTLEMEHFYQLLLGDEVKNGPGKKLFHEKFGTSRGVWPILQKKFGELEKNPKYFLPGKLNVMYNKQPSLKSGNGIKGFIWVGGEKIHFRSSLELRIYLYLRDNNINFSLSKHSIKYELDGRTRTYHPDIVINTTICEIKPKVKINWKQNKIKHKFLLEYCKTHNLECTYITETTYDLSYITSTYIMSLIENGTIIMNNKEINRMKKYFTLWKNEQSK